MQNGEVTKEIGVGAEGGHADEDGGGGSVFQKRSVSRGVGRKKKKGRERTDKLPSAMRQKMPSFFIRPI
jgi:hypothetical protein